MKYHSYGFCPESIHPKLHGLFLLDIWFEQLTEACLLLKESNYILINDVDKFEEVGACGTAALITPIGTITHDEKVIKYNKHAVSLKLKETLLSIQYGEIEDKFKWVTKIN